MLRPCSCITFSIESSERHTLLHHNEVFVVLNSDGGLHAASAAASAVSRRLDRIASAHGAASRRLFGRSRRSRKASASTGGAQLDLKDVPFQCRQAQTRHLTS